MSLIIVLLLRSINGLRDIPLPVFGSLHYGLVWLMILLKEQHHWYLQSTSKSRLTYSTIVELDLDFPRDRSLFTGGGGRATKVRKSLSKKLWPTPIKGLKKVDPPKTQIKKL